MKHSPAIELANASRALQLARETCAHWDHEGHDAHEMRDCCYELDEARQRVRKAAKAT